MNFFAFTIDPISLWDFIKAAGLGGLLFFILVGGRFRVWVWSYQVDELRQLLLEERTDHDEEIESVRKELTGQLDWFKKKYEEQQATTNNALLIGEKLTRALERATGDKP